MKKYILPKNLKNFKANLSAFSALSIGSLSPLKLKEAYFSKGYSVLALSDFERLESHKELCDDDFIFLTAYNTNIGNYSFTLFSKTQENDKISLPQNNTKKELNEFIENANKNGYLVSVSHPAKSMQTFSDFSGLSGYFALEIANFSSLTEGYLEDNNHIYDRVLRNSKSTVFPLACDGNKNEFSFDNPNNDSFGAFTVIYAESLTYENVIAALENGDFYSSTGPEFNEIYIEDNKIHISCSPVRSIRLLNEGRDAPIVIAPKGETITEAVFELDQSFMGRFIRVDIRDNEGNFADTVPYYFESEGENK